jgi:hypothetical protein
VIQDVAGSAVLTSYTRWLESVQLREGEDQEVYVTFSPRFERIWLESKKRLSDYMEQKPANTGLRSQYSLRLYSWAKSTSRPELKAFRSRSSEKFSAWSCWGRSARSAARSLTCFKLQVSRSLPPTYLLSEVSYRYST